MAVFLTRQFAALYNLRRSIADSRELPRIVHLCGTGRRRTHAVHRQVGEILEI